VASPGTSRIPARPIPTPARDRAVQPSAARINKFTEASSRKIDTIGEKRNRADHKRDDKLDAEISKIGEHHKAYGVPKAAIMKRDIRHYLKL
jgi:hypothetical protein